MEQTATQWSRNRSSNRSRICRRKPNGLLFVAQGIRRDTDRWRVKQQRYSEAARRREELAASRKEQENAEMIYYLNRFQEEHRAAEAGKQESGAQEADR